MFPVRCYTCNTLIGHHHAEYARRRTRGEDDVIIMKESGITRMCCRRMFISHVESLVVNQLDYPNKNIVVDRGGTTLLRQCKEAHTVPCD